MKTTPIRIAGRTFALAFTLDAMCMMQDAIEGFDLSKASEYVRTPSGLLDVMVIMARQGEMLEGRVLDVDRAWFGSHISPAPMKIAKIQIAVLTAMAEGMRMDTESDEDDERDEVLDEIKKKEKMGA